MTVSNLILTFFFLQITVIREWDLGKEDGHISVKEKERERKDLEKKKRQRSRSPLLEAHLPPPARKFKKKEEEPPTAKLLDDLFRKTKATPCIYWLPLTNEQVNNNSLFFKVTIINCT